MIIIKGKSTFRGIGIGPINVYKKQKKLMKKVHVEDTKREIEKFEFAKDKSLKELQELYEKACKEVGEKEAAIFDIHQMMLKDQKYCESIINLISKEKTNVEYAIATITDHYEDMFINMEDSYMKARHIDIRDISERLLDILMDTKEDDYLIEKPSIIVAEDFTPSEIIHLDKNKVLGLATVYGSIHSHTAMLARAMNIPAVIGMGEELKEVYDNHLAIIDGFTGIMYINPDKETMTVMRQKQKEASEKTKQLQELKGKENVTLDGKRIEINANISSLSDLETVIQNDADGIGLFRSEFLYLEREDYPLEEEQFLVYKNILEKMAGKKVVIRTLDIGADKKVSYFNLKKEKNPALGYRGIRICLKQQDLFKTQLRGLLRASVFGNLSIMFPMIISLSEIKAIKKIIGEVKQELEVEEVMFKKEIEIGVMIETPAAVMISDQLAEEVDFFSIGTNDLTQYTLAIDRQNEALDDFYDPHHPAILKMIEIATNSAHAHGIWIGICGELAADLELTEQFLEMGIDELSVAPGFILELRKNVREIDVSKVRRLLIDR